MASQNSVCVASIEILGPVLRISGFDGIRETVRVVSSQFRGPPSWYSDPITTEHRITTFFGPQGISVATQRWAVRSHCKDTPFAGAGATANCMSRTYAKSTQQDAGRGRADLPLQHFKRF